MGMSNDNDRIYRRAINFDLSQAKIKEHYPGNRTKAYSDIKAFFERNNFEWRQGSGYTSKEPLANTEIAALSVKMDADLPWLKDCVKEIDVTTVVEDAYSIKGMLFDAGTKPTEKVQQQTTSPPPSRLEQIKQRGAEYEAQREKNTDRQRTTPAHGHEER